MNDLVSTLHPRTLRFEKFWNTYVRVGLPWRRTYKSRYWEMREFGDSHGPNQYIELQPSSHVLIDEVSRVASNPNVPILDLGCNVGRHLNALHQRGFTNLYGVDVQRAALKHMPEVFPEMCKVSHVEQATFQDYLPRVADSFFEVVFTHGITIELIPPSFPICQHMARTAKKAVVMVVNENARPFPRLWETEFLRANFLLTKILRPATPGSSNSLFVFLRMT